MDQTTKLRIRTEFEKNTPVDITVLLRAADDTPMQEHLVPAGGEATIDIAPGPYTARIRFCPSVEVVLNVEGREQELLMTVPPFQRLRGRTLDADGPPLDDVVARIGYPDCIITPRLSPGEYDVLVFADHNSITFWHEHHPRLRIRHIVRFLPEELDRVTVMDVFLPRGCSLTGQIGTADGGPLPERLFFVHESRKPVRIGPDGAFALEGCVMPGTVRLWFFAEDEQREIVGEYDAVLWCEAGRKNRVELQWPSG